MIAQTDPEDVIGEELEKIPAGASGNSQNQFRPVYHAYRRHELPYAQLTPAGKSFTDAVISIRKFCPSFRPEATDPKYLPR